LKRLNSIEHIFPQSKKSEWEKIENGQCGDCPNENENIIDCFGNLALISAHMNGSLSDDSVNKKLKIKEQLNRGTIESLKMIHFYTMIEPKADPIKYLEVCSKHQETLKNLLIMDINDKKCATEIY